MVRVTEHEKNFLKSLAEEPRDNRWVQEHLGLGWAYWLARRGLVENNTLGVYDSVHTNFWKLTEEGRHVIGVG